MSSLLREAPAILSSATHAAPAPAVLAEDVTKRYGDGVHAVDAVRGVSLSIDPGEIVALEGPSGSG